VFALGSVLTYAATGADPFSQGGGQTLVVQVYRVVTAAPNLAGVPGTIRSLVAACLEKDPAKRPTAAQVLNALQALPEYGQHSIQVAAQPQAQARPAADASPFAAPDDGTFAARQATPGPMAAPAPAGAPQAPNREPPIPEGPGKPRHHGFGSELAAWFNRVPRRPSPDVESESPPADEDAGVPEPAGPRREWWNEPPANVTPPEPTAPGPEWWNRPPANATPAEPAPPAPARVLEARAQAVDPASINSRDAFCAALDEVRERANLSTRDVAIASGLLLDTVRGYFVRGRLPAERDVLRQILRVCGVPEEDLPGWDEALLRVRQRPRATPPPAHQVAPPAAPPAVPQAADGQEGEQVFVFKPSQARASSSAIHRDVAGPNADEADLLFHVYIPKTELYAEQRRETLRHFREYLANVEGQDIRQEDFSGQNGETVSFYVAPGQPRPPLEEKIQEFANFVDHCAHSPERAITHLTRIGLPRQSSATVVTSYAKRFHRMEMDLRHERANRINALEQQLESELLDKGGDPHGIATLRMSIRSALEQAVPPPTAAAAMPSLSAADRAPLDTGPSGTSQPPTGPGTGRTIQGIVRASVSAEAVVRDQQVYSADPTVPTIVYNLAINSVRGTEHFGPAARRLLGLIEGYGNEENGPLRSALHEIEDPGIPAKTKTAASRLLTAFLADLASKVPDIGTDALAQYLEARPGSPGS